LLCEQIHKTHLNYHLVTPVLSFTHKTIECVHQTYQAVQKRLLDDVGKRKIKRHLTASFSINVFAKVPKSVDIWQSQKLEVFTRKCIQGVTSLICETI